MTHDAMSCQLKITSPLPGIFVTQVEYSSEGSIIATVTTNVPATTAIRDKYSVVWKDFDNQEIDSDDFYYSIEHTPTGTLNDDVILEHTLVIHGDRMKEVPVSYTHLTLPTIYSV